ncbi:FAD-dependent monooxygenase [Undibacterium cyanobacteriorum]|uniref:FAD-dependent monooxygenase n=1 Tax=Undibacterium cyanobacteriorum TaxID=3073561 RepID=A0ABY9RGL8_9BURK|nr:FAD-dependent monooxygenase [Undibacterium sp. 20NA77.5]WMW80101.1 FAD-dependent monooxygenase [Undibacterium sp. 20NA77.5]
MQAPAPSSAASPMTTTSSHPSHYRFVICGAGPVGQALALELHRGGVVANEILLIDAKNAEQVSKDARTIALSHGSQQLLERWHASPQNATAIREIHVSRRRHFGRTLIHAQDYSLPALGYVVRYGDIINPLERSLTQADLQVLRPQLVAAIHNADDEADVVRIALAGRDDITADCVIQAEGGIFSDQVQRQQHRDYQQSAVIAHVNCAHPIAHRAFERFTEEGPIALLPQDAGYSLVWCCRPERANSLQQLDDVAFLQALQTAFGDRVGQFTAASPRFVFTLGLNAQADASRRTVKIGNAAQTLHPVAGQGLNLGLRDAFVLAQHLLRDPVEIGIEKFMQTQEHDRQRTIKITDGMARLFAASADGSALQTVLGLGLSAVDLLSPLKRELAEQMMFGRR